MGRKNKRKDKTTGERSDPTKNQQQQEDQNDPKSLLYKRGAAYSGTIATRGFFQKLAGFTALVGLILFMSVFTDPTPTGEKGTLALRQIMERFTKAMRDAGNTFMSSPGARELSGTLSSLFMDPSWGRVALVWLGIIFFVVCPFLIRLICSVFSYFAGWRASIKMAAVAATGKTCRAKSSLNLRIVNTVLGLLVGIPLFIVTILVAYSLLETEVVRIDPRMATTLILIFMLMC